MLSDPHADPEATGELCLGASGEGRGLLVAHPHPLDSVLATDGIGDRVQGIADHAPHLRDAMIGDGPDEISATVLTEVTVPGCREVHPPRPAGRSVGRTEAGHPRDELLDHGLRLGHR